MFYSPNGGLYVVSQRGDEVQKLVGSRLQTVIASDSLAADMKFQSCSMFVTKEKVIYLRDNLKHRILGTCCGGTNPKQGQINTSGPVRS